MKKRKERTEEEKHKLAEIMFGKNYGKLGSIWDFKVPTTNIHWMDDLEEEKNRKSDKEKDKD